LTETQTTPRRRTRKRQPKAETPPQKPAQFTEPSAGGYQLLPPLTDEERADLTESIKKFGVRQAVTVDENNIMLDGHHRAMIAAQLGVTYPIEVVTDLSDQDKRRMVRQLNLARRHLTRKQKEDIIAAALKDEPEKSDRQHAADLGVSPTTVGTTRKKLEASGQVSKLDTRTDRRGAQRSATTKQQPKSRRGSKPWNTPDPPPQSRDDQAAEAMVASFRDGLGKARVLPDDHFKTALAPLKPDLVALLERYDQEDEA
jgi:DNA-binding MarR family transcriptional regulator